MTVLVVVLALDVSGRLRSRQLAAAAIGIAVITAGSVLSLVVNSPHGH